MIRYIFFKYINVEKNYFILKVVFKIITHIYIHKKNHNNKVKNKFNWTILKFWLIKTDWWFVVYIKYFLN